MQSELLMVHSYLPAKPNGSLQSNARPAWSNWIRSIKVQNDACGFWKKTQQFSRCPTTACNQGVNSYFFFPKHRQEIITYREFLLRRILLASFSNQQRQLLCTPGIQDEFHLTRGHCVSSSLTSKTHFCCSLITKDLLEKNQTMSLRWVCSAWQSPKSRMLWRRLWRIAGWMEALSHSPPSPTSTLPAQIPPAPLIWIKLFQFIRFPCSHPVSKKPLLKCQVWI